MKFLQGIGIVLIVLALFAVFGKDAKTAPEKPEYKSLPVIKEVDKEITKQKEEVRLSENVRSKYLEGCVDATDGIAGGYAYCECTIKWLEDHSVSNSALLAEFASYETADGITPRMEKAIDFCINKID